MRDRDVAVDEITNALTALGIPAQHLSSALELMPKRAISILVYGSRARHDFTPTSDLDVLVLVREPRGSLAAAPTTMSFYTPEQLASASGTLFGMHLARDGVVLHDTDDTLGRLLRAMEPPDPRLLLARVRHYAATLDASDADVATYVTGMTRTARYLLRTAIYALALEQGSPCFSVRELAQRFDEPALAALLSSDPAVHGAATPVQFRALMSRLTEALGTLPRNPYGSPHALIVAEWYTDRKRATLAILATASSDTRFDYAELPKVLL